MHKCVIWRTSSIIHTYKAITYYHISLVINQIIWTLWCKITRSSYNLQPDISFQNMFCFFSYVFLSLGSALQEHETGVQWSVGEALGWNQLLSEISNGSYVAAACWNKGNGDDRGFKYERTTRKVIVLLPFLLGWDHEKLWGLLVWRSLPPPPSFLRLILFFFFFGLLSYLWRV